MSRDSIENAKDNSQVELSSKEHYCFHVLWFQLYPTCWLPYCQHNARACSQLCGNSAELSWGATAAHTHPCTNPRNTWRKRSGWEQTREGWGGSKGRLLPFNKLWSAWLNKLLSSAYIYSYKLYTWKLLDLIAIAWIIIIDKKSHNFYLCLGVFVSWFT